MRRILATIVFAVLFGGVVQAQITRHAGSVQIQGTGAEALDNAGGAEFGSGNVELIGTDGKINGPLSTTIIDDLSAVNLSGFLGDVTGTGGAMVVGDNSHAHTGTTISALGAGDVTTGTFANARIAVGNVTQHQGSIDHGSITGLGDDDHTIYGQLTTAETVSGAWIFSEAPEMTGVAPSTPDVQKVYKESIVKAWARMTMTTSACSVTDGYNIASATRDSTGVCTMTFGTALPNANYGVFCAGDETTNSAGRNCSIVGRSTTTVQTLLVNSVPSTHAAIDAGFSILVIGE